MSTKVKTLINYADLEEVAGLVLVHYGSTSFDIDKFNPIENVKFVKPDGGLWTSPIDSEFGWKDWCDMENFRDCKDHFIIQLDATAKVVKIDSLDDLLKLPMRTCYNRQYPDYERVAQRADAIWLTDKGQEETRFSDPVNLYGWDCESVLIMNPEIIAK